MNGLENTPQTCMLAAMEKIILTILVIIFLFLTSCDSSNNYKEAKEKKSTNIDSSHTDKITKIEDDKHQENNVIPLKEILNLSILLIDDVKFYNDSFISRYIISEFLQEPDIKESLNMIKGNKISMFPNQEVATAIAEELVNIPKINLDDIIVDIDKMENLTVIRKDQIKFMETNFKTISFSFPIVSNSEKSAILIMKQQYKKKQNQWLILFVKDKGKWIVSYIIGVDNTLNIKYEVI